MRPRAESNGTESSTITARPPMPPPPPPLSPLPSPLVIDTHNTTTTTTTQVASRPDPQERQQQEEEEEEDNREVLKREVQRRSMSLTVPERTFLDHLAIHGNAVEVQLAVETLENDDLFFDWETPRHLKETTLPPDVPTPEGRPFLERNLSLGSQRRLKILEERKHAKSALWQAHESGIAITQAASRKSLVQRSSSLTSVLSGSSPPFPPPPFPPPPSPLNQPQVSSSSSTTVVGQSPPADDIFRRSNTTPRRNRSGMMAASPMRRARHQRSQSMIVSPTPPRVPTPVRFATSRRRSSSNKSVSFHPETTPNDRTKTRKGLRRSVSDSLSLMAKGTTTTKSPTSGGGGVAGRPPLPQPQHQHQRMDSMSSIPSIHHGHPIRSESISSIPSLHPASAIRSGDSVCSIPSLHSAHPIHDRSGDSSTTTTSSTVPPILQQQQHQEEEQANKIRSLLDDDDTVPQSLEESHKTLLPSSPTRKVLVHKNSILDENKQTLIPKYSATPDIASAWLKQQQQQQSGNKYQSKALEFESSSSFLEKEPTDETESTRSTIVVNDDEDDNDDDNDNHHHLVQKSVLVRRASRNIYDGEGMEVTELDENAKPVLEEQASPAQIWWESNASIRACNSFDDETMSYYSHRQNTFDEIFRSSIRRTLSDEEVAAANILVGSSVNVLFREVSNMTAPHHKVVDSELEDSWDMNSIEGDTTRFDSWNILKDEYANGYGGAGTLDFHILGTCADDESASPHVLSPPLMESLTAFLPYTMTEQNFFLRYSLVRDGASMLTFLKRSRGVQHAILALETVDGEVFGCFTGQAWRKNWSYFGNGESFLWKMRRSRLEKTTDIVEQAQLESEIDVYPYTGENKYIQLCTQERIAVGGGTPSGEKKTAESPSIVKPHEWGFGLALQDDLLAGSSSPCVTFGSPGLSTVHADGSLFEIVNLELWTLTPCSTVEDAERMEVGKLFLQRD